MFVRNPLREKDSSSTSYEINVEKHARSQLSPFEFGPNKPLPVNPNIVKNNDNATRQEPPPPQSILQRLLRDHRETIFGNVTVLEGSKGFKSEAQTEPTFFDRLRTPLHPTEVANSETAAQIANPLPSTVLRPSPTSAAEVEGDKTKEADDRSSGSDTDQVGANVPPKEEVNVCFRTKMDELQRRWDEQIDIHKHLNTAMSQIDFIYAERKAQQNAQFTVNMAQKVANQMREEKERAERWIGREYKNAYVDALDDWTKQRSEQNEKAAASTKATLAKAMVDAPHSHKVDPNTVAPKTATKHSVQTSTSTSPQKEVKFSSTSKSGGAQPTSKLPTPNIKKAPVPRFEHPKPSISAPSEPYVKIIRTMRAALPSPMSQTTKQGQSQNSASSPVYSTNFSGIGESLDNASSPLRGGSLTRHRSNKKHADDSIQDDVVNIGLEFDDDSQVQSVRSESKMEESYMNQSNQSGRSYSGSSAEERRRRTGKHRSKAGQQRNGRQSISIKYISRHPTNKKTPKHTHSDSDIEEEGFKSNDLFEASASRSRRDKRKAKHSKSAKKVHEYSDSIISSSQITASYIEESSVITPSESAAGTSFNTRTNISSSRFTSEKNDQRNVTSKPHTLHQALQAIEQICADLITQQQALQDQQFQRIQESQKASPNDALMRPEEIVGILRGTPNKTNRSSLAGTPGGSHPHESAPPNNNHHVRQLSITALEAKGPPSTIPSGLASSLAHRTVHLYPPPLPVPSSALPQPANRVPPVPLQPEIQVLQSQASKDVDTLRSFIGRLKHSIEHIATEAAKRQERALLLDQVLSLANVREQMRSELVSMATGNLGSRTHSKSKRGSNDSNLVTGNQAIYTLLKKAQQSSLWQDPTAAGEQLLTSIRDSLLSAGEDFHTTDGHGAKSAGTNNKKKGNGRARNRYEDSIIDEESIVDSVENHRGRGRKGNYDDSIADEISDYAAESDNRSNKDSMIDEIEDEYDDGFDENSSVEDEISVEDDIYDEDFDSSMRGQNDDAVTTSRRLDIIKSAMLSSMGKNKNTDTSIVEEIDVGDNSDYINGEEEDQFVIADYSPSAVVDEDSIAMEVCTDDAGVQHRVDRLNDDPLNTHGYKETSLKEQGDRYLLAAATQLAKEATQGLQVVPSRPKRGKQKRGGRQQKSPEDDAFQPIPSIQVSRKEQVHKLLKALRKQQEKHEEALKYAVGAEYDKQLRTLIDLNEKSKRRGKSDQSKAQRTHSTATSRRSYTPTNVTRSDVNNDSRNYSHNESEHSAVASIRTRSPSIPSSQRYSSPASRTPSRSNSDRSASTSSITPTSSPSEASTSASSFTIAKRRRAKELEELYVRQTEPKTREQRRKEREARKQEKAGTKSDSIPSIINEESSPNSIHSRPSTNVRIPDSSRSQSASGASSDFESHRQRVMDKYNAVKAQQPVSEKFPFPKDTVKMKRYNGPKRSDGIGKSDMRYEWTSDSHSSRDPSVDPQSSDDNHHRGRQKGERYGEIAYSPLAVAKDNFMNQPEFSGYIMSRQSVSDAPTTSSNFITDVRNMEAKQALDTEQLQYEKDAQQPYHNFDNVGTDSKANNEKPLRFVTKSLVERQATHGDPLSLLDRHLAQSRSKLLHARAETYTQEEERLMAQLKDQRYDTDQNRQLSLQKREEVLKELFRTATAKQRSLLSQLEDNSYDGEHRDSNFAASNTLVEDEIRSGEDSSSQSSDDSSQDRKFVPSPTKTESFYRPVVPLDKEDEQEIIKAVPKRIPYDETPIPLAATIEGNLDDPSVAEKWVESELDNMTRWKEAMRVGIRDQYGHHDNKRKHHHVPVTTTSFDIQLQRRQSRVMKRKEHAEGTNEEHSNTDTSTDVEDDDYNSDPNPPPPNPPPVNVDDIGAFTGASHFASLERLIRKRFGDGQKEALQEEIQLEEDRRKEIELRKMKEETQRSKRYANSTDEDSVELTPSKRRSTQQYNSLVFEKSPYTDCIPKTQVETRLAETESMTAAQHAQHYIQAVKSKREAQKKQTEIDEAAIREEHGNLERARAEEEHNALVTEIEERLRSEMLLNKQSKATDFVRESIDLSNGSSPNNSPLRTGNSSRKSSTSKVPSILRRPSNTDTTEIRSRADSLDFQQWLRKESIAQQAPLDNALVKQNQALAERETVRTSQPFPTPIAITPTTATRPLKANESPTGLNNSTAMHPSLANKALQGRASEPVGAKINTDNKNDDYSEESFFEEEAQEESEDSDTF